MRSKETFGTDADVFRPERWLEAAADEERFKEMSDVIELAFGYGRFQCLGKTIAYMELNKIFVEVRRLCLSSRKNIRTDLVTQLLRRFDFAVVKPQEPLNLYDAAFWVTTDFWLRVTRRPDTSA